MYRRLLKYSLSTLAILLIAGCSYDTEINSSVEERVPVTFELATVPLSITRTTTCIDEVWSTGMEVSVKCTADGETNDLNKVKKYVTASNGGSGFKLSGDGSANTFYWLNRSAQKSFELWYPYSATKPTTFPVDFDQASNTNNLQDYDLLYASVSNLTASSSVVSSLSFYHQMSCLKVIVTEVPSGEEVTGVTVGYNNVAVTGTWTAAASNYVSGTGGASWTIADGDKKNTIILKKIAASPVAYCCILPPQSFGDANTTLITITTKETATPTNTHTYTCNGAITLYAGNLHTYSVNVAMGLSFKTTVTAWPGSSDGNYHGGSCTY